MILKITLLLKNPSPSPCRRLQSTLSLIPKLQNYASILLLQLLLSPLTTGFALRKTSYSQILKLLLFVFVIRALPRGFFLLKNPQIARQDDGLLTALATIRKQGIQERPRLKNDSALVHTPKQLTANAVYISLDESG
jgi:hypothetical protein